MAAPARRLGSIRSLDSVIIAEIDAIRSNLKGIPSIQVSRSSEDLAANLKKFRKNTRENATIKTVVSMPALVLVSNLIFCF